MPGKHTKTDMRYEGFHRAEVVEVDIEDNDYGAVRVFIPDLYPPGAIQTGKQDFDEKQTGLIAYPANCPMGGYNQEDLDEESAFQSALYVPRKGARVWVFFESGRPDRCFYFAAYMYRNCKVPPENRNIEYPHQAITVIKTKEGRTIVTCDSPDQERVEITGKKRKLSGAPTGGDGGTVYNIDGNQTVILLDERAGKEKVLIRTYKGDYVHIDVDQRKLQMHFDKDINIETLGDLNLTIKGNLNILAGGEIHKQTGGDQTSLCGGNHVIQSSGINSMKSGDITSIDSNVFVHTQKKSALDAPTVIPDLPKGDRET